jgi:hypothetical protein
MWTARWLLYPIAALALGNGMAWASCNQAVIPQAVIQPAMERLVSKLQAATNGSMKVYSRVLGKRVILTDDFESLTGPQKLAVLEPLRLGYADWTHAMLGRELTAPERAKLPRHWEIYFGAMSPYEVYTADGTMVSVPYDGCTRMVALTEQARYRVLWNRPRPRGLKYPIDPAKEKNVKALFWRFIGYRGSNEYWIGWVPERGHFEIDVPDTPSRWFLEALKPFWDTAPTNFKYVVYSNDGTRLYTHVNGQPDAPRAYVPPADDAPRGAAVWRSL